MYRNQGKVQPFGYTGYKMDEVAGTYFAQAREYLPEAGRFAGEEKVYFVSMLKTNTMNLYNYCYNNPMIYIDLQGYVSEDEAEQLIIDNAEYIKNASEIYEVDSRVVTGVIYVEQVRNVDWKVILGYVFGIGNEPRVPNKNPKANEFGNDVEKYIE